LSIVKFRAHRDRLKEFKSEPVDRSIQYIGSPMLALRHQYPLEPFDNNPNFREPNSKIPTEIKNYDPIACGFTTEHRHGVTVPGFWPGNVREYGLLSYFDRSVVLNRKESFGIEDNKSAIKAQGILSSFAYTFGQACYQGFSTLDDMTYPLSAQTILTDGQKWSFYRYQLNSTVTHTHAFKDEPHYEYNQCWGTEEMNLYEHCDENGKIHGLNDDVFKQLISFYLTQPKQRDYDMKPYLDSHEKKIADIEDVERRAWLERTYKHIAANRPRQLSVPEIYDWEKIYKIDNKTRPMDKKRRFFELKINPFSRRLDEHRPEYIPRHLRPKGIYDTKIFQATYYPLDHRSNDPKTQSLSEFGAAKSGPRRKYDRSKQSFK
jgi:small subunit ribosomal protein S30